MRFLDLKEKTKKFINKNKDEYSYVTGQHIVMGRRECVYRCPLSLALKEILNSNLVVVGPWCVEFGSHINKMDGHFLLSPGIKEWIEKFDNKERVSAFEFKIDNDTISMYDRDLGWV